MVAPLVIAEWPINNRREKARVSIEHFNGAWLINVRKWYEADDGAMHPGKQGIALSIKHLPQLAEAITNALAAASERELIPAPANVGSV
jgi:hypothetical protein